MRNEFLDEIGDTLFAVAVAGRLQGQTRRSPTNTAQAARHRADAAPCLAFDRRSNALV
jgi:hypothetical protein